MRSEVRQRHIKSGRRQMFRSVLMAWLIVVASIGFPVDWAESKEPEIVIIGSVAQGIDYWKQLDFWGEVDRKKDLDVPRVLVVAINKTWKKEADGIAVALKKELFYRGMSTRTRLQLSLRRIRRQPPADRTPRCRLARVGTS